MEKCHFQQNLWTITIAHEIWTILTLPKNLFSMFDVVLTSHLDFQDSKDQDFGKKIISLKRH